ncbi:MAG: SUMF1/EgtB/PvdO family nonheme iron enzyme [Bryobacterales bacterium]|nr:SUMF1/EgtB/PvdO family nonheme iron enzyme [Bryobacterales bacterium]
MKRVATCGVAILPLALIVLAAFTTSTQETYPGFALIPAGSFLMGDHHELGGIDHANDEYPLHQVRINSFQIGIHEVTNRQYIEFLNAALPRRAIRIDNGTVYGTAGDIYCETQSATPFSRITWDGSRFSVPDGKEDHPMVCVRWHGAAAYTNWLNEQHGFQPCYDAPTWDCDIAKSGFRLPTEAEWEYAARGGRHKPYSIFPWGDDPHFAKANWPQSGDPYEVGPMPHTTPVGFYNGKVHRKGDFHWPGAQESYQTHNGANGYGLYDVAGNVWEWVNDWYGRDYYRASSADNPPGPSRGSPMPDGKPYRTLRGGSWYNGEYGHSRVSNRNPSYYRGPRDPDHPYYAIGFRVLFTSGFSVASAAEQRTAGLFLNAAKAAPGYTLFAPKHGTTTYLMANDGRIVHSWKSEYEPGQSVYLLPNGNLLRAGMLRVAGGIGGGEGGIIEEFDWNGNLVWEFRHATRDYQLHHDIKPLPNGNVLALMVERKSEEECIRAGFNPEMLRDGQLNPDAVIEIQRSGPKSGTIVWEWHVWDHLVQDFDRTKANYGDVATHPELIDAHGSGRGLPSFWNHINSVAYDEKLDQIVLSVRGFNEVWVIDHGTTIKEAAGHKGGRRGKGGDLLYRWGNPVSYKRGTNRDRQLFQQHDAHWIPGGYPGAGHMLIFNNGLDRGWSTIEEIVLPLDPNGSYRLDAGKPFGPEKPVWSYKANPPDQFYSAEISGTHRLPNGNTLICAGVRGVFFEVTPSGDKVWEYVNPEVRGGILAQGEMPGRDHRGHNWNAVFKIHRYEPEYAGLQGRDLTTGKVLELPASQRGKTGLDRLDARPEDGRKGGKGRKKGPERKKQ